MSLPGPNTNFAAAVVSSEIADSPAQVRESACAKAKLKGIKLQLVEKGNAELIGSDTDNLLQGCQDAYRRKL